MVQGTGKADWQVSSNGTDPQPRQNLYHLALRMILATGQYSGFQLERLISFIKLLILPQKSV